MKWIIEMPEGWRPFDCDKCHSSLACSDMAHDYCPLANAQPYEAKGVEGLKSALLKYLKVSGGEPCPDCDVVDNIRTFISRHPAPDRTEELVGPDKWVGKSSSKPCFCLGPDKCSDNTCEIRRRYLECVADYEKGAK